ncbi:Colicin I receptor precursor [compost metagenome]
MFLKGRSRICIHLTVLCIGLAGNGLSQTAHAQKQSDSSRHNLDEVVVTAQYQPQSLRRSVYKMQVIDQKKIEARAATNVQQILSGELGIRFTNDMALGTADISLMGMSGRNIKILMDGVPVLDRGDIRESLNQINAAQIERIEIIEGPMSTMYGSDALAGVINIITKKSKEKTLQLQAQVAEETVGKEYSFGTNKGLHTQQLGVSWDNKGWNAQVGILHYDFGGFGADSIGRGQSWKPKEQWLPSVKLGYHANKWDLFYRNDYLLEQILTKLPINLNTYRAQNKTFTTSRMAQQAQFNYRWNPNLVLNSSLAYTDYARFTRTELIDYRSRTISLTNGDGDQDTAKFNSINFRASAVYNVHDKLSIQPGIEYSWDKASGDRIKGMPEISNYAGFVSAEYKPTDRINIRPGVRFNKNSKYDAPPALPSLNTLFRFNNNLSLRLSYARGFRAPSLTELYLNFQDANHDIEGNPVLKAENSNSFNGSITYRKPVNDKSVYSTEIGYFYNVFDNQIVLALAENSTTKYTYVNIANNKTTGISFTNKYTTQNIEWKLGGLLLGLRNDLEASSKLETKYGALNWSPEVNVEVMYHIQKTKTRINLFYKYTAKRTNYGSQKNDQGEQEIYLTYTQGYHLADVNVQQRVSSILSVTGGVRNIFNVSQLQSTTTSGSVHGGGGSIAFSYGRSYFVSLNVNFNNKLK